MSFDLPKFTKLEREEMKEKVLFVAVCHGAVDPTASCRVIRKIYELGALTMILNSRTIFSGGKIKKRKVVALIDHGNIEWNCWQECSTLSMKTLPEWARFSSVCVLIGKHVDDEAIAKTAQKVLEHFQEKKGASLICKEERVAWGRPPAPRKNDGILPSVFSRPNRNKFCLR